MSGTIRSLCDGIRPIVRSDGKYVRDHFYIEDAADANLMLAEKLSDKPKLRGEAFNFLNETRSVLEIVEKIIGLIGLPLTRRTERDEPRNPPIRC